MENILTTENEQINKKDNKYEPLETEYKDMKQEKIGDNNNNNNMDIDDN